MSHTVVEKFIYKGLGFDIELHNVEMALFAGESHPIIDVAKVAKQAMHSLIAQNTPFTGNQIHFVRTYFQMNQTDFAALCQVKPAAVVKWEAADHQSASLDNKTATHLKNHIQHEMLISAKNAEKDKVKFQSQLFSPKKSTLAEIPTSETISKKYKK